MSEFVLDLGGADEQFHALDPFTRAYIEAAFWTGDEDVQGATFADLTSEALAQMISDCLDFRTDERELLDQTGADDSRHGVDFWLTRNHHGAGFWDRGYPSNLGKRLTDAAHAFGSVDLYVGDDGKVYQ